MTPKTIGRIPIYSCCEEIFFFQSSLEWKILPLFWPAQPFWFIEAEVQTCLDAKQWLGSQMEKASPMLLTCPCSSTLMKLKKGILQSRILCFNNTQWKQKQPTRIKRWPELSKSVLYSGAWQSGASHFPI